jgi:hypothetical protein
LTVESFRSDPQLNPHVAELLGDASNIPLSQAARKREDRKNQQQKFELDLFGFQN